MSQERANPSAKLYRSGGETQTAWINLDRAYEKGRQMLWKPFSAFCLMDPQPSRLAAARNLRRSACGQSHGRSTSTGPED